MKKLRNSWKTVADRARASRKDGPHITRHTAATWQMQAGTNLYEAAGYLGISRTTADRYWAYAKAFLFSALRDAEKGIS